MKPHPGFYWKNLISIIIYGGFVGTLTIKSILIITEYIYDPKKNPNDDIKLLVLKAVFLFGSVLFFCFDFTYGLFSKRYENAFLMFIDAVIVVGLAFIIPALELETAELPSITVISFIFFIYMLLYSFWSSHKIFNLTKNKIIMNGDVNLFSFYTDMFFIELFSATFFISISWFAYTNQTAYKTLQLPCALTIVIISLIYLWAINRRKDLSLENGS